VIEAIIWGLVQGLTEFLPISSSGHLVLIPELLGFGPPTLATSAVLHLGTLAAVVLYFRKDLWALRSYRRDATAKRTIIWLVVGSLPAAIGLLLREELVALQESTIAVSSALIVTGLVLLVSSRLLVGTRRIEDLRALDAGLIGVAQALALIPGISRSGMTITAALGLRVERSEAARFSFLLGIPAITAAGLLELSELVGQAADVPGSLWVGVGVAALSGYAAIAFLLRMLKTRGLAPFGYYAIVAGIVGLVLL